MTVSSTSTNAEVKAAYDDNAGYDIDRSDAKCKTSSSPGGHC